MIIHSTVRVTSPSSFSMSPSTTCNDVHACRIVPTIAFNCASTIFLCTWAALHLNVPEDPAEAWWKCLLRRVGWMTIALLSPELVLFRAFADWIVSSEDLMDKLGEFRNNIWALLFKFTRCVMLARAGPNLQLDGNTCTVSKNGWPSIGRGRWLKDDGSQRSICPK